MIQHDNIIYSFRHTQVFGSPPFDRSYSLYMSAIGCDPTDSVTLLMLGKFMDKFQQIDSAEEYYLQALAAVR